MTFTQWLIAHTTWSHPIGRLATDYEDSPWPADHGPSQIEGYLIHRRACREAREAYHDAWLRWSGSWGTTPGFVYFIGGGDEDDEPDTVKIGYSTNLPQRMAALQAGNGERLRILAQFPGCRLDEKIVHRRFADFRSHGEWFRMRPIPAGENLSAHIWARQLSDYIDFVSSAYLTPEQIAERAQFSDEARP